MADEALVDAVRTVLREAAASGAEITARHVRAACERRLGLPPDGLLDKKEELMRIISATLNDGGDDQQQQTDQRVDPAAVREVQTALADPDGGPTRAALLVAELTGEGATAGREALEAMAVLSEACATSEAAARRLLDAHVAGALAAFLPPTAPKAAASLAVRLLSAMAMHAPLTEALVRSAMLPPLLARLNASLDGSVGVQCATLLHNLADGPASRMRLMHAGTLLVLTRVLVEPAADGALKEHCLQAAASLCGMPEAELSFPELLGAQLASPMPGTQKGALEALQIIRERQGAAVDARLAGCAKLVDGLANASGAKDAHVAANAQEMLSALRAAK